MKSLILGFGTSGWSAALFLLKKGYEVWVIDKDKKKDKKNFFLKKIIFLNEDEEIDFSQFKFLVISSGISKKHPIVIKAKREKVLVLDEVELAFLYIRKNICIGITGSNGKTTVTSLIEFVLNQNNIKAVALGNIGKSVTSYLLEKNKKEVLIIELSSFQLSKIRKKILDIAVILNISEDHIDWHGSLKEYVESKFNIQNCLKKNKKLFISHDIKKRYFKYLNRKFKVFDYNKNNQNVEAAYHVCKELGIKKKNFLKAFDKFKSGDHRIELVNKISGILFYNDSKSTNAASTIYAVEKLKKNIILIVGGVDKNICYKKWKKIFKGKVKYIFLIGRCAKKMEKELKIFNPEVTIFLKKAVNKAFKIAERGDKILLSPGFASFDQFDDYIHRGKEFKRLVNIIEKRENVR
ncbi:MAG: hypothetical protein AMS24_02430 [Chlamydiae bacterium SM23_39]|nr:MAG: hypothetical protein AMS24_02430 [Chlamydiae bacterium SM23_39]